MIRIRRKKTLACCLNEKHGPADFSPGSLSLHNLHQSVRESIPVDVTKSARVALVIKADRLTSGKDSTVLIQEVGGKSVGNA
jgi:hypothetical protein